jgi:pathogenesis-related protein 1
MIFILRLIVICSSFCMVYANALDSNAQTEMVNAHNKYRKEVGIADIKWSSELAKTAQAYANKQKANKCKMKHSGTKGLGENIYWASAITYSNKKSKPQDITPTKVTDSWGSEKANYSYDSNTCASGKVCGHYTQIVWSNTTEVGCGMALCSDNSQFWVCNYTPPGNYRGQKPY